MSILIKGLELPKDGCHHTICIYADGTVSTGGQVYKATLVPPHGRLIDADALEEYFVNDPSCLTIFDAIKKLQGMSTIIPAEEGK